MLGNIVGVPTLQGRISGPRTLTGYITYGMGVSYPDYEESYNVTPSESEQTLPTNGYHMTDDVTVEAIPDDYVGSNIPQNDLNDVSVDTANNLITIPAGYYEQDVNVSLGQANLSGLDLTFDFGTGQYYVEVGISPGGYIPEGFYTQPASQVFDVVPETTITPSNQQQVIGQVNSVLAGPITVDPIPSNYGLITWNGSVLTVS